MPAPRLSLQSIRVLAQHWRGVFFWGNRERNEMHVCLLERFLHFAHPAADHRAGARAGRINKIGDPNFLRQIGAAEGPSVLISQPKCWDRTIIVYYVISETLDFDFPQ